MLVELYSSLVDNTQHTTLHAGLRMMQQFTFSASQRKNWTLKSSAADDLMLGVNNREDENKASFALLPPV